MLEQPTAHDAVATETLLELEDDLREVYFHLPDNLREQKIDIRNTDGEPVLLHTVRYEISSFERAFHALKSLELNATRRPE
jgi:hypothetical protein